MGLPLLLSATVVAAISLVSYASTNVFEAETGTGSGLVVPDSDASGGAYLELEASEEWGFEFEQPGADPDGLMLRWKPAGSTSTTLDIDVNGQSYSATLLATEQYPGQIWYSHIVGPIVFAPTGANTITITAIGTSGDFDYCELCHTDKLCSVGLNGKGAGDTFGPTDVLGSGNKPMPHPSNPGTWAIESDIPKPDGTTDGLATGGAMGAGIGLVGIGVVCVCSGPNAVKLPGRLCVNGDRNQERSTSTRMTGPAGDYARLATPRLVS